MHLVADDRVVEHHQTDRLLEIRVWPWLTQCPMTPEPPIEGLVLAPDRGKHELRLKILQRDPGKAQCDIRQLGVTPRGCMIRDETRRIDHRLTGCQPSS